MSSKTLEQQSAGNSQTAFGIAGALIILSLGGVGLTSRYALLSIILDGLPALLVVAASVATGFVLVPLFRLGPLPRRWHILIAAALGLGFLSLSVLLLGLAGLLHRPLWIILVCLLTALGFVSARRTLAPDECEPRTSRNAGAAPLGPTRYLWLLAAPFLCLAVLAASNAPGFIWQEEGYGYDVLEYHVQLPKEYREAGQITYLPHNVYAAFPANVEMLYLLNMILQDDDLDTGTGANLIHLLLAALTVFAAWVAGREWSPRAGLICAIAMASAGWLTYLSGLAYTENGMLFFGTTAIALVMRAANCRWRNSEPNGTQSAIRNPQSAIGWIILPGVIAGFACGCKYTALPMIALPLALVILLLPARSWKRRLAQMIIFVLGAGAAFSPWLIKNQIMTGNPVFPLANKLFKASPPGWGAEETARWDRAHTALPEEQSLAGRLMAFWRHVPGDRYHRFGPMLLLLGVIGLAGRRRDRQDLILLLILVVQWGVWLFATHLFARFAVVFLIPLALLAGRALGDSAITVRGRAVLTFVILGALWNFAFTTKLVAKERAVGAPGALIYDGDLAGYEYFDTVNRDLPSNAKILLIGDARAFYFQRQVDYCVVFNKNPFVETIRSATTDHDILAWLRSQGYTHVLVNWSEVRRLANTYGFADEVNEILFQRLTASGVSLRHEFEHPQRQARYVTLYEVTPG